MVRKNINLYYKKVIDAELTEVLRQKNDSIILKNAMMIRDFLKTDKRNHLVFVEKKAYRSKFTIWMKCLSLPVNGLNCRS